MSHNITFDVSGKLIIGDKCLIAKNVTFQDCSGHHIDPAKRKARIPPEASDVRSITIGNNVWIGTGAYILPGVTIGDNCVVAAMSTISRSIPPDHIVYPTPSKAVKIRNISDMF